MDIDFKKIKAEQESLEKIKKEIEQQEDNNYKFVFFDCLLKAKELSNVNKINQIVWSFSSFDNNAYFALIAELENGKSFLIEGIKQEKNLFDKDEKKNINDFLQRIDLKKNYKKLPTIFKVGSCFVFQKGELLEISEGNKQVFMDFEVFCNKKNLNVAIPEAKEQNQKKFKL